MDQGPCEVGERVGKGGWSGHEVAGDHSQQLSRLSSWWRERETLTDTVGPAGKRATLGGQTMTEGIQGAREMAGVPRCRGEVGVLAHAMTRGERVRVGTCEQAWCGQANEVSGEDGGAA